MPRQKWPGKIPNFFPEALHPQIPAAKSQEQKCPSILSGWLRPLRDSSPQGWGSRRRGPAQGRPGAPVNPVRAGRSRRGPCATRPRGPSSTAHPKPAAPAVPSPLRRARRCDQAAQTKRAAAPGAAGAKAVPRLPACLPPSLARLPQSPQSPGPTPFRPGAAARDRPGYEPRGGRSSPGPRRGRRPPPCLPAPPRSGVRADKARRRRGRSGGPGRPRRPPRDKRGQEPRKPGALMQ